jgi:hypothetical protein
MCRPTKHKGTKIKSTDLGIFESGDIVTLFDPLSFFFRGTLENYMQSTDISRVHLLKYTPTELSNTITGNPYYRNFLMCSLPLIASFFFFF